MNVQTLTIAGNPGLQDRLSVLNHGDKTIIALADGAGGMSGGAQAAQYVIDQTQQHISAIHNPTDCETLLHKIDRDLADRASGGETTGIILAIDQTQVFGASVGDSEAWFFATDQKHHLTKGQFRKPLLGSGEALAVKFQHPATPGILLVASDGLWKYTSYEKIADSLKQGLTPDLPQRLVSLVRLRSGALHDDIAIATLEVKSLPA
jgi:serine/threonine protein phosphatase PrpC